MGRTHRSLRRLRRRVERAGFATWAGSYPSRRTSLEALAGRVAHRLRSEVGGGPLLAVTHSLGSLIVRHTGGVIPWSGAVMIAPPNQGSRVARALWRNPLFRGFYGEVGRQLSDPAGWPPPPCPCAVIAGTAGASWASPPSWLIRALALLPPGEPSDGTLTVDETRVEGMVAFATVRASHTWIMNHPGVARLVLCFLETGRFDEPHGEEEEVADG